MQIYKILLIVIFVLVTVGCGKSNNSTPISKEMAETIALEDAPQFKPDNRNFSIVSIEREKMGYRNSIKLYDSWVIILSSQESNANKPTPNLMYQINVDDGSIIDRTNFAFGE
ncbi:hypothetical protein [Bacillus pinisoli]|uniref:hypothetical protein n=1 Tax=Bacillus pinisoli TaxID=2901866 RepID=UPI001FF3C033|nr:hypothetical protein [Bacillus pinisoli]